MRAVTANVASSVLSIYAGRNVANTSKASLLVINKQVRQSIRLSPRQFVPSSRLPSLACQAAMPPVAVHPGHADFLAMAYILCSSNTSLHVLTAQPPLPQAASVSTSISLPGRVAIVSGLVDSVWASSLTTASGMWHNYNFQEPSARARACFGQAICAYWRRLECFLFFFRLLS
jgi:hypothetical protein